jgi:hypothetical protein
MGKNFESATLDGKELEHVRTPPLTAPFREIVQQQHTQLTSTLPSWVRYVVYMLCQGNSLEASQPRGMQMIAALIFGTPQRSTQAHNTFQLHLIVPHPRLPQTSIVETLPHQLPPACPRHNLLPTTCFSSAVNCSATEGALEVAWGPIPKDLHCNYRVLQLPLLLSLLRVRERELGLRFRQA